MTETKTLAETVTELRKQRGLRKIDLAIKARLSAGYINDIESGRRLNLSAKSRDQLSRALSVPPEKLGDVA